MEWIETDEMQRVKKINDTTYQVVDLISTGDFAYYYVTNMTIDINEYEQDEIKNYVSCYYNSLEHLKSVCNTQDDFYQLVCEIIAETEMTVDKSFENEEKAMKYLEDITH